MDKSQIAVDVFDRRASVYQDKFMDVSLYGDTFDFFCNMIGVDNAAVLDIACGPGNITKYLLNKRPDFKILGIDLSQNMINLAQINNPAAQFRLMDCRKIILIDERYNAIMCGFCLPYLTREEAIKLIADAAKLLNPNGLLYISTMEDDYTKSAFKKSSSGDEMFIHYHQEDYLIKALEENGFEIIDLNRISYPGGDNSIITDLILIGRLSVINTAN